MNRRPLELQTSRSLQAFRGLFRGFKAHKHGVQMLAKEGSDFAMGKAKPKQHTEAASTLPPYKTRKNRSGGRRCVQQRER